MDESHSLTPDALPSKMEGRLVNPLLPAVQISCKEIGIGTSESKVQHGWFSRKQNNMVEICVNI